MIISFTSGELKQREIYHCLSKVNLGGSWQSRGQPLGLPAVDTAASLCQMDGSSTSRSGFVHSCNRHRTEMPHCMGSAATSTLQVEWLASLYLSKVRFARTAYIHFLNFGHIY